MKTTLLMLVAATVWATEPTTNRTVFLGDSQMDHGWSWVNDATWKSFGKINMVKNAGVSGGSTAGMITRLDADVWAYSPDVLVFSGSLNDAGTEAQSQANLIAISQAAKARGVIPVLVTLAPNDGQPTRTLSLNTMIRAVAVSEGIQVFDMMPTLADVGNAWANRAWTMDGTHLSFSGAVVAGSAFVLSSAYAATFAHTSLKISKVDPDTGLLSTNSLFAARSAGTGACTGQTVPTNWGCQWGNPGGSPSTPAFSFVSDGSAIGSWYRMVMSAGVSGYWQVGPGVSVTVGHLIDISFRIRIVGMDASTSSEGNHPSFALMDSVPLEFWADIDGVGHARYIATSGNVRFWLHNAAIGAITVDIAQFAVVDLTTQGASYAGTGTWASASGLFPLPSPVRRLAFMADTALAAGIRVVMCSVISQGLARGPSASGKQAVLDINNLIKDDVVAHPSTRYRDYFTAMTGTRWPRIQTTELTQT